MKAFPQSWYETYYLVGALCQIGFWAFVTLLVSLGISQLIIRKFIEHPR